MREKVMKALNQTGEKAATRDSIDMALCMISRKTNAIEYAGANRPLFRTRNGELTEFKPDFMTIGLDPIREKTFSNITIEAEKGDTFYMFSDGFPDQFGGASGKKLKLREFKKLIEQASLLDFSEQKDFLEKEFLSWKGTMEQVDDVMVFGFRV
jgi:serine phosphatase RsbU (regulator of sigma subunit)